VNLVNSEDLPASPFELRVTAVLTK
jgi:hypothetical protein